MQIIPVASGKGGVGKSLIAANLGIALAQSGKKVVLVDLDLGGSNLHLILGQTQSARSIGTYLADSAKPFETVLSGTDIPNLAFVGGDAEIPGLATITSAQKRMLSRRLMQLDADYVVVDLGAGTHQVILDFFLMSARGIVVTTPTPTATVNAYLFVKNAVFRILQSTIGQKNQVAQYWKSLFSRKTGLQRVYIPELLNEIDNRDKSIGTACRERLRLFQPRIVLNMVENPKDAERAGRLRRSCQQYLDIDPVHLGVVYRDDMQDVALSSRLPIVRYKPNGVLAQAIYRIADKVQQLRDEDDTKLDIESVDDSYDAAGVEAEDDFDSKMNYIEELLHTGALSTGDLVETIKSQHFEITQLRKQNRLFKTKLSQALKQGFILGE